MAGNNRFLHDAVNLLSSHEDKPINVDRFNHHEIVRGLHSLYYDPSISRGHGYLRISYFDGSESLPLPVIDCTAPPPKDDTITPLRLGFLSGRHPEMDAFIDFYIMRNCEQHQYESSADLEQEVYERTMKIFMDPGFRKGWPVEVYQTGLQTVTIGFYRAVIDAHLRRAQNKLAQNRLVPYIWLKRDVDINELITRSKGAMPKARILQDSDQLCAELPDFITMKTDSKTGAVKLSWRKDRPIWISEYDYLIRRFPGLKPVISSLFSNHQYRQENAWGI